MLTPAPPNPADFELGVDSPKYKKQLSEWKVRKDDERKHPENYGDVPIPRTVVHTNELDIVTGQLAAALKRIEVLEAVKR